MDAESGARDPSRKILDSLAHFLKPEPLLGRTTQIRVIPFGPATYFSVQKPFGSSMIGHRSERFCVFLPIFAGRDGEGNEQKLGEEWGQAKQWKFVLKNPSVNGRSHLEK